MKCEAWIRLSRRLSNPNVRIARSLGRVSTIPEGEADPVPQFSSLMIESEVQANSADQAVRVGRDSERRPVSLPPGLLVRGDPTLRDAVEIGMRDREGSVSDFASPGESLHNRRVVLAERPKDQALGANRRKRFGKHTKEERAV